MNMNLYDYLQRGEILTSHYLLTGELLSPEQVSDKERYFLPYLKVLKEKPVYPVVVGMPLQNTLSCADSKMKMNELLDLFGGDQYVMGCCSYVSNSNHDDDDDDDQ